MITHERATGRDIILAIGENMRQSLEPLVTRTLAPSLYQIYLHPDDYDRLRTILPQLEAEARALLDGELERLNRGTVPPLSRLLRKKTAPEKPQMRYESAEGRWSIRFQEDPNGDLGPGEIKVVSEFARPGGGGYGAGSATKRISTTRKLGRMTSAQESVEPQKALARIAYRDDAGPGTFWMASDEIVIGRESPDGFAWVHLRLKISHDVSREHARIKRDPETGKFLLKDLSKLGTTIDGVPVPRSGDGGGGSDGERTTDRWVDLPDRARIGLAGVILLDFEKVDRP